ncbi:hypothetical protein DFH07DRAFT_943162 [Mycena maculata]|uniref:Uncharacterized protein n=1 Tax=Mycena maculata TaxID=230809 RepID=A0AAD7II64_9AGAR|nr:hypothetical protein DFH07DRAFT_943162 [Mycena maculata]
MQTHAVRAKFGLQVIKGLTPASYPTIRRDSSLGAPNSASDELASHTNELLYPCNIPSPLVNLPVLLAIMKSGILRVVEHHFLDSTRSADEAANLFRRHPQQDQILGNRPPCYSSSTGANLWQFGSGMIQGESRDYSVWLGFRYMQWSGGKCVLVMDAEPPESQTIDYPGAASGPTAVAAKNEVPIIQYEVFEHTGVPTCIPRCR